MVKREIPSTDWQPFLESFTLQHDGWLVSVESIDAGRSALKAENLPLEGVVAHVGTDEPRNIVVTVGGTTATHGRIVIPNPEFVRVESDNGVDTGLEIEAGDGSLTRVSFRSPVPPESVDGLVT